MEVLVKIFDAKSRQEIEEVSINKEVLELVLQSRKFLYNESKYDIVEFIPGIFESSILSVSKVPNIYK